MCKHGDGAVRRPEGVPVLPTTRRLRTRHPLRLGVANEALGLRGGCNANDSRCHLLALSAPLEAGLRLIRREGYLQMWHCLPAWVHRRCRGWRVRSQNNNARRVRKLFRADRMYQASPPLQRGTCTSPPALALAPPPYAHTRNARTRILTRPSSRAHHTEPTPITLTLYVPVAVGRTALVRSPLPSNPHEEHTQGSAADPRLAAAAVPANLGWVDRCVVRGRVGSRARSTHILAHTYPSAGGHHIRCDPPSRRG